MIVTCEQCRTDFQLDDRYMRPGGTRVRCSVCRHVFIARPASGPVSASAHAAAPPDMKPDETRADAALSVTSEEVSPAVSEDAHPSGPGPEKTSGAVQNPLDGDDPPKVSFSDDVYEKRPPVDKDRIADDEEDDAAESMRMDAPAVPDRETTPTPPPKKRYISFRKRLMFFAVILIGFFALIFMGVGVYLPKKELHSLIEEGKNLAAGVSAAIDPAEMDRMNRFAMNTIERDFIQDNASRNYFFISFNMMITEDRLLAENEILKELENFDAFNGKQNFDYEILRESFLYWRQRFILDPGIKEIFIKYKRLLMTALENAAAAGSESGGIMIMLDTGKKVDFFENRIAYLLDGYHWSESVYCGEPYQIKDNEFWRAGALTGRVGYDHNPVSDPDRWYLPHFDTDEFGSWFGVWRTVKTGDDYNIISIDFNARRVVRLLGMVVGIMTGLIILLVGLALLIANSFSKSVTRPIRELTRGAQEVSGGNYEYEVPVIHEDELGEFTRQFNTMNRGLQERLNLMKTMERFMSKELAEQAANTGLLLSGKRSDCTVMFTDFAGFSTITKEMTAGETVEVLNAYFEELIPIIKKYSGFTDKYIGDAIVAIFGAPVSMNAHAERAVACAIEMQWKMRDINIRRRREGRVVFEMRIGLNSGEVIVGAFGCNEKLEYTSIGETTNLANRMESGCEIGHVMIADGTYQKICSLFFKGVHIVAKPEKIQVKGYPKPVDAYRIWVDNREISKDIHTDDPKRNLYTYADADHALKYSPREVSDTEFSRRALFLKTGDDAKHHQEENIAEGLEEVKK